MSRTIVRRVDDRTVILTKPRGPAGPAGPPGTSISVTAEMQAVLDAAYEAFTAEVVLEDEFLQTIGGASVASTGTLTSPFPWMFVQPVTDAGFITEVVAGFEVGSSGNFTMSAATLSGDNITTKGATITIAHTGDVQTFTAPEDFTAMPVAVGDYILFYSEDLMFQNPGAGTAMRFINPGGTGDFDGSPSASTEYLADLQVRFKVTIPGTVSGTGAYIKTRPLTQAQYDGLVAKDPYTLYVIV